MTLFSSGGSRQILILPGLDTTTTATKLLILSNEAMIFAVMNAIFTIA